MYPQINKMETGKHLRRIMSERGITVKEMQNYLGLGSVQSIYHWLNGISMPTIDNLYALSELFCMPMDEIVCGNRRSRAGDVMYEVENARCRRFYAYYNLLNSMQLA